MNTLLQRNTGDPHTSDPHTLCQVRWDRAPLEPLESPHPRGMMWQVYLGQSCPRASPQLLDPGLVLFVCLFDFRILKRKANRASMPCKWQMFNSSEALFFTLITATRRKTPAKASSVRWTHWPSRIFIITQVPGDGGGGGWERDSPPPPCPLKFLILSGCMVVAVCDQKSPNLWVSVTMDTHLTASMQIFLE